MDEKILQELQEIKKELQDIRSILEQRDQLEHNSDFTDYLLQCTANYYTAMTKRNVTNYWSQSQSDEA
ncbi:MAG: hypothetical protein ABFC57_18505 [Veillonellales bacterium]